MADNTKISWAEATWPISTGCKKVSPGCDSCYAATLTGGRLAHLPAYAGLASGGDFTGEVRLLPDRLDWPLRWTRPRRIFVASMSDAFHRDVPDEYLAKVFAVVALAPQHTFQFLTKRHGRMRSLLSSPTFPDMVAQAGDELHVKAKPAARDGWRGSLRAWAMPFTWPLRNAWMGVSVEDQRWADIRIPALLQTPAAVRWISAEPLLGPVSLHRYLPTHPSGAGNYPARFITDQYPAEFAQWKRDTGLSWVVAGGESGPGARPMHEEWARTLRDQCAAAGVPFHYKQRGVWTDADGGVRPGDVFLSENGMRDDVDDDYICASNESDATLLRRVSKKTAGRELDGREWNEYPDRGAA